MHYPKAWPERFLVNDRERGGSDFYREIVADFKGPTADHYFLWPGVKALEREWPDRTVPSNCTQWAHHSGWARSMIDWLADAIPHWTVFDHATPEQLKRMIWNQLLITHSTARWLELGRRYYAVDPDTAHALIDTNISDFPRHLVRFPVPCFWMQCPRKFDWKMLWDDLPHRGAASVRDFPPEHMCPVSGWIVNVDEEEDGMVKSVHFLSCAESPRGQDYDVTCDWRIYLTGKDAVKDLGTDTLVEYLQEWTGTFNLNDSERKMMSVIVKLTLAFALYATSVHPSLVAHKPLAQPKLASRKKKKKKWRDFDRSTRATVTYVGGPHETYDHVSHDGLTGRRKPPKPHVRQGHFRHQHVGPRDLQRVEIRWIRPLHIGSWDRVMEWETQRAHVSKARVPDAAVNPVAEDLRKEGAV